MIAVRNSRSIRIVRRAPDPGSMRAAMMFALFLLATGVAAQDPAPRPRLGLVLSGGGARGLAHIGVLQVLEELRVPVDCVAGTSMGAIVGGLYAYGYDPYAIERLVVGLDWPYLLQDSPRRSDLSIRRKQEEYEFLVQLRVGYRDGGIALPKGLVQGQNLGIVLDQLTLEAHDLASFDDLPLPFRCVAADIGNGRRIVFDRGDLPRAMRASMALPGIFAPVDHEQSLLVDGGILDNLSVEAARAMGAERVIAVDIGTPPSRLEDIRDLLGITSQMVALLTQTYVDDAIESLRPEDLLIQPQLGALTAADFARGPELIALGREWALRQAGALRRFAVGEAEFAAWRHAHRRVARPLPIVTAIEIAPTGRFESGMVADRLTLRVGERLDLLRLKRDLERIHGLDLFELVRCRVRFTGPEQCVLEVRAIEKSWGPGYLRFSLDAGSDFNGGNAFSVGLRYVETGIGPLDAEWATTLRLGTDTLLQTEWFQPLFRSRALFVAPAIGYSRRPLRAPVGSQITEFTGDQGSAQLDVGTHWIDTTELRFGIDRGFGEYEVEAGLPPPGDDEVDDGGLHAQAELDTLDRSTFPTSGLRAVGHWRLREDSLGAERDYSIARFGMFGAVQVLEQVFALRLSGQWQLSGVPTFADVFPIGGLFNLSGLGAIDLVGLEGGVASLLTYRRLSSSANPLQFPLYAGGSVEAGGLWDWGEVTSDDVRYGGSVFAGIDSPLGPIFLALGFGEGGERAAYFTLGQIRF
jgi:NTE family protein